MAGDPGRYSAGIGLMPPSITGRCRSLYARAFDPEATKFSMRIRRGECKSDPAVYVAFIVV